MKKQILTLALLATFAVGGAYAGKIATNNAVPEAGPLDLSDDTNCNTPAPNCIVSPAGPECMVGGVQFYGKDVDEGNCSIFLSEEGQ